MKTFALCCFLALPLLAAAQHRFDYQWPFGYGPSLPDGFGISKLDFTGGPWRSTLTGTTRISKCPGAAAFQLPHF